MSIRLALAIAVIGACGASSSGWSDFYGIQYQAPAGTTAQVTDSVLPGPGGEGGTPVGERPDVVLILPGAHGFRVQIIKPSESVSLDGMKYVLVGNKVGSNHVGTATKTGWELTYDVRSEDSSSTSKVHIIYADIAGGHYQCEYDEASTGDPVVAEAICRSLRPKAGK